MEPVREEIKSILEDWLESFVDKDLNKFMGFLDPDQVLLMGDGNPPLTNSFDEIYKLYKKTSFSWDNAKIENLVIHDISIYEDLATACMTMDEHFVNNLIEEVDIHVRISLVLVHKRNQWLIRQCHVSNAYPGTHLDSTWDTFYQIQNSITQIINRLSVNQDNPNSPEIEKIKNYLQKAKEIADSINLSI